MNIGSYLFGVYFLIYFVIDIVIGLKIFSGWFLFITSIFGYVFCTIDLFAKKYFLKKLYVFVESFILLIQKKLFKIQNLN